MIRNKQTQHRQLKMSGCQERLNYLEAAFFFLFSIAGQHGFKKKIFIHVDLVGNKSPCQIGKPKSLVDLGSEVFSW